METKKELLTVEALMSMPKGYIIATGIAENSPDGIYMTDSNIGRKMRWAAKRGNIHDWAIYTHWAEMDLDYILDFGDKITNKENIKKLVPCDDEAFKMYRY